MSEPTKNCPFCGEQILQVAIKCKHCQSLLGATPVATAVPKPSTARSFPDLDVLGEPLRWVAGTLWFWLGTLPPLVVMHFVAPESAGVTLRNQPGAFLLKAFILAAMSSMLLSAGPALLMVALQRRMRRTWLPLLTIPAYAGWLAWMFPDWINGWLGEYRRYLDSDTFLYAGSLAVAVSGHLLAYWRGRVRKGVATAPAREMSPAGAQAAPKADTGSVASSSPAEDPGKRLVDREAAKPSKQKVMESCPSCGGEISVGATRCLHCWKAIPR